MPRSGCSAFHGVNLNFKKKRYGNFASARIKLVFNDKLRFSPRSQQLFDKFIKRTKRGDILGKSENMILNIMSFNHQLFYTAFKL